MKLLKTLLLTSSILLMSGCGTNQGAALTVDNATTYLEPLQENEGNANFDATNVYFNIYPNSTAGKLFSSDIKGKCSVSFKYATGFLDWNDPIEVKDIVFEYKAGGTSEGGIKQFDSLAASFVHNVTGEFGVVNVYNLKVTEISGHMLP